MNNPSHPRAFTWRGFTLVELLISSALTVMVILILIETLTWLSAKSEDQVQELDRSAKARMILDLIEIDLQSIGAISKEDAEWLCLDILKDEKNTKLWVKSPISKPIEESCYLSVEGDVVDYRFGKAGMWLRLFTTAEDRSRQDNSTMVTAELNAVAYQIIRRELSALNQSDNQWAGYQLFRSIVRGDHVFKEGYRLSNYEGPSYLGYPGEIKSPRLDSAICEQVVDLGFRVFEKLSNGEEIELFPNRDEVLPALESENRFVAPRDGVPTRIEVYVRVLTPRGAEKLRLFEQGKLSSRSWWYLVEQESRVYRRVVSLPQLRS